MIGQANVCDYFRHPFQVYKTIPVHSDKGDVPELSAYHTEPRSITETSLRDLSLSVLNDVDRAEYSSGYSMATE